MTLPTADAYGSWHAGVAGRIGLREQAHVTVPERGHTVGWVRKNHGAQCESTWNVWLADGTEVHLAGQLEDLGLALPRATWPTVGRVQITAVPREGWRHFFEYMPLERETGFEPATSTLASRSSTVARESTGSMIVSSGFLLISLLNSPTWECGFWLSMVAATALIPRPSIPSGTR